MLINGLNKTTLLDYPGRVAATIFTGGCNFRCPFCHNAGLVLHPGEQEIISEEELLSFLMKRKNILKGVCITGGEPTLQADLPDFIRKIRKIGYKVKLDTNGSNPALLKDLLEEGLLDYVAMDIKNCMDKYETTVGLVPCFGSKPLFDREAIKDSVQILKAGGIDYEFRTTVIQEFHEREDLLKIAESIQGCPHYFMQQYQDNDNVIAAELLSGEDREVLSEDLFHGYEKDVLESVKKDIEKIFDGTGEVGLRGFD